MPDGLTYLAQNIASGNRARRNRKPDTQRWLCMSQRTEEIMTIKFKLSDVTPETIQTMTIHDLESILKEFGFDIVSREPRTTKALVHINLNWRDDLGYTENRVSVDIRDLVTKIIYVWNQSESDILPVFGSTGPGTSDVIAIMESEPVKLEPVYKEKYLRIAASRKSSRESLALASIQMPTNTKITIKIVSLDAGINGKPTATILSSDDSRVVSGSIVESHLLHTYTIDSILECRASVFSFSGIVSVEIMEVLSQTKQSQTKQAQQTPTFSPTTTIGAIVATIKIVNTTGKFEIVESSCENSLPVGKQGNSTVVSGSDFLGKIKIISCHLTDKGSIKIDSISEPVIAPVTAAPVIVPVISSVPTIPSVTVIETPEPVKTEPVNESPALGTAMALNADIDLWQSPDYYISPDSRMAFDTAYKFLKSNPNVPAKLVMTGAPGYGKTTIAQRFAEFIGFHCYRLNCAAIRDTEEWYFDREVKSKITTLPDGTFAIAPETVFTVTEFAQTIARGNCVVILDEFNRVESNIHNSLFPLLDDSAHTNLHHIDFRVGPNVIFVATINLGAKFAGTFLLDDALTNRFDIILPVKPMPYDHECAVLRARHSISDSDSEIIVRMAMLLRENEFDCPTRDTLKIARMVSVGLGIRHAFEYVIVSRIPDDSDYAPVKKTICDLINTQIGTRGSEFALVSSDE